MIHLRLVLRMGQATGSDIVAAYQDGHLTQQEWAEMVQSCRGCEWARHCPDWMDRNETLKQTPMECANRDMFATLRVRQSRVGG